MDAPLVSSRENGMLVADGVMGWIVSDGPGIGISCEPLS